jgi:hypothetical protein
MSSDWRCFGSDLLGHVPLLPKCGCEQAVREGRLMDMKLSVNGRVSCNELRGGTSSH